jgi:hypothetical protein
MQADILGLSDHVHAPLDWLPGYIAETRKSKPLAREANQAAAPFTGQYSVTPRFPQQKNRRDL